MDGSSCRSSSGAGEEQGTLELGIFRNGENMGDEWLLFGDFPSHGMTILLLHPW